MTAPNPPAIDGAIPNPAKILQIGRIGQTRICLASRAASLRSDTVTAIPAPVRSVGTAGSNSNTSDGSDDGVLRRRVNK